MDKVKKNFQSKQPVVPTSWEIIPFQKAVSIISDKGKRIKQKQYLEFGEFPVIDQGQDYIGGYTNDKNLVFDGNLPVIVFGDHTRAIKYLNEPFVVGADGIKILKPENCFSFKFFYFLLTSLQIPSRGYSRHFQFLRNFNFPLPPLPEQNRIVAEIEKQFSRLDEAVAGLKRIQTNLKRYRASVLKAAVEGKLTAEWRKQHPGTEPAEQLLRRILKERRLHWEQAELKKMLAASKPPRYEQWKQKYKEPVMPDVSGLPALPNGWIWCCAEQICSFITKGTTPSASKLLDGNGDIRFLKVYNLTFTGNLNYHYKPVFIDYLVHHGELQRSKVQAGDILINIVGPPLGQVSLIPCEIIEANINQAIARFRPLSGVINRYLMYILMTRQIMRWAIKRAKTTVGQANLTLELCRKLPLPLAPLSEQNQIIAEVERRLSIADEVEQQINTNLKRAERLRQAILKKGFSGRLVPQDPSDEPASVLLEKIKKGQRA